MTFKNIASSQAYSNLNHITENAIQPNAVDITLETVFKFAPHSEFVISETTKTHRKTVEVLPDKDDWFHLETGTYEIRFGTDVSIADGEAGWVITRSTLNRNGLFITSGLYDSGYSGAMAGALHVTGGPVRIKRGTRIGQFLLADAEALKLYNGSYGFDADGKPKADEMKYHSGD